MAVTRFAVVVELGLDPALEEQVRWAVERAAEQAAVAGGAEVFRVTATSDPL